ncbi:hypothetical protein C8Q75DRAFT_804856 [Abortiporus biennis]|nr:hypothetical protein C8Q75DRAFT_804856 [Abortiporus biennis]
MASKPPPSSYFVKPIDVDKVKAQTYTSVFRNALIETHIYSPSVRNHERREYGVSRTIPVFGDRDKIEGVVHLDPRLSTTPGRLTVSMEGAFVYISPFSEHSQEVMVSYPSGKHRHLFFTSSVSFATGETTNSPRSASSLRDAFTVSRNKRKVDRRPSLPDMADTTKPRAFLFSFDIPRPTRPGEEMPPTFSSVSTTETAPRGRTAVERAEVEYKIVALWETNNSTDSIRLDSPICYQSDSDFQSLDGLSLEPESWLEIPLRSDRPIPFKCALTLPVPSSFSRSASIPYFVVFSTKPRSALLAREIAVDATIAVSLLRQVTILTSRSNMTPSHLATASLSSSSNSGDDSDGPSTTRKRIFQRVAKSASSPLSRQRSFHSSLQSSPQDKPLPDLPPNPRPGVLETRTLQTEVSIGFPKRPRNPTRDHAQHPSLDQHTSLPDGLYKGNMKLHKNMLPSIDWAGLSVKYFIEVSVLFGQDELRARIPIRIV